MKAMRILYIPSENKEFHDYIFKHFTMNGPVYEAEVIEDYEKYCEEEDENGDDKND